MRQVLEGGENFKMDTYLSHHGILGQKWGVRRYQNTDGSLTEAGRRRYDTGSERLSKREAKAAAKATVKAAKKEAKQIVKDRKINREENNDMAKKKLSQLSDDELAERIARLKQEKEYYALQKDISSLQPKQVNEGKELVKKFLKDTVEPAAANAGKAFLEKKLKEKLGVADSVDSYEKMTKEIKNWNTQKAYAQMQAEKEAVSKPKEEPSTESTGSSNKPKEEPSAKTESSTSSPNQTGAKGAKNKKQSEHESSSDDSKAFRKEFDKAYKEAESSIKNAQKEADKKSSQAKESEPIDYSKYKVKKPTDIIDVDFYEVSSDNLPAVTNASRDIVSTWSDRPIAGLLSSSTELQKRRY